MILTADNNLDKDEEAHMKDSFFPLRRLKHNHSFWAAFTGTIVRISLEAEAVFLLCFASLCVPQLPLAIGLGCIGWGIAAFRSTAAVVMICSIVVGKFQKRIHRRALTYFSWWPLWNCLVVLLSASGGTSFGHFQWFSELKPYREVKGLQSYKDVNPAVVPGVQIQDAGLVEFSDGVDIDRAKGGCFVGGGHTYCVAPILYSGALHTGLGNTPTFGSYDYFAVGVDCCSCPNQDFRCGEWKNPLANGGIRSLDFRSRPFFRLAVDDWSATFMKEAKDPLFFDWVQNPEYRWATWWRRFLCVSVAVACMPLPIAFLLSIIAGHVLRTLIEASAASPLDAPKAPKGFEKAWAFFFPEIIRQYDEDRKALMAIPVGPPPPYVFYGTTAPVTPATA
mmetsp:Transcript_34708/g.73897  ORF Transcript_34708/g.73897 Transcript_34708/m.73897 type:complete len:392 (+) Transcript_34708:80-1255(+)